MAKNKKLIKQKKKECIDAIAAVIDKETAKIMK